MKNNKILIFLLIVSVVLIGLIIYLMDARNFHPPKFDKFAKPFEEAPTDIIAVTNDYKFYIEGEPILKDGYLYINFYSLTSEDIYLKVRILENDNIISESGLIKSHEYLEKIKYSSESKRITYLVMSYEKDTYLSMGEVRLHAMLGEQK